MTERAPIASRVAAAQTLSRPSLPSSSASTTAAAPASATSSASSATPAAAGDSGTGATTSPAASTNSTAPPGESSTDSSASGDSSADGNPDASGSNSGTEAGDGATYGSDKERIDAAALALEKGDLASAVAALGRRVKLPETTAKAFTAISKREQKHRERVKAHDAKVANDNAAVARAKHDIAADSQKNANARRELDQRYGWTLATERAWDAGDMVGVAKGIERLCRGASLATITQRIAGMSLGKGDNSGGAPSVESAAIVEGRKKLEAEQAAFEKRQREEQQAREKTERERTHQQQRTAALDKFGAQHAKHPFLANPDDPDAPDPEARDEAFAVYEKAWQAWQDGKLPQKPSAKKVLDDLHARQLRQLKRLGITPAAGASAAPSPKAGTTNGKGGKVTPKPAPPPAKRLQEPPATNGRAPTRDETRAARMALAKKLTEQQTRGLRA